MATRLSALFAKQGTRWIVCQEDRSPPLEAFNENHSMAADAARRHGEAIYLCLADDQMRYEHVRGSEVLRKLLHIGAPPAWVAVEGSTESWEDRALFDPGTPAAERVLIVGSEKPYVSSEDIACLIGEHFGIDI